MEPELAAARRLALERQVEARARFRFWCDVAGVDWRRARQAFLRRP